MKLKNLLLAVTDIDRSVMFYQKVLGLQVIADFGANKTLTGGLCLQTLETCQEFIEGKPVTFAGHSGELYFEEADFDAFLAKLALFPVEYIHPIKEHGWGQRVVRFYDPDHHIIEVGEPLEAVCHRFARQGMTVEQIAQRMDVPLTSVITWLK